MSESNPERWMRRAIDLSQLGFPAPNPHVGCVIVRDGEIVGEGYHDHAGGPHAEAVALLQAGNRAKGSDVYVTLEPCNHFGRTGPCSEALVHAGIRSLTYSVGDPNPRAMGGAERLKGAGIAVSAGLLKEEAAGANRPFLTAMALRRPYVTLKAAISLDGKIAWPDGTSKWITGEAAREDAHRLRAEMGAVLVGAGTVTADNPHLTARIPGVVNQPVRVVLDPGGAAPADANAFAEPGTFYRFVEKAEREGDVELPANGGIFNLRAVLGELWNRGLTSLLVEGGAVTLGSFLKDGLFERLDLYVAPIVIGDGLAWSGGFSSPEANPSRLRLRSQRQLGEDICLSYEAGASGRGTQSFSRSLFLS